MKGGKGQEGEGWRAKGRRREMIIGDGSGSQQAGIAPSCHLTYQTQSRDEAKGGNADTQLIHVFIGENMHSRVELMAHPPLSAHNSLNTTHETAQIQLCAAQHSPSDTAAVLKRADRYNVATWAAVV